MSGKLAEFVLPLLAVLFALLATALGARSVSAYAAPPPAALLDVGQVARSVDLPAAPNTDAFQLYRAGERAGWTPSVHSTTAEVVTAMQLYRAGERSAAPALPADRAYQLYRAGERAPG